MTSYNRYAGGVLYAPVTFAAGINATVIPQTTVVTYSGSLYACKVAHVTTSTFDSSKWLKIVDGIPSNLQDLVAQAQAAQQEAAAIAADLSLVALTNNNFVVEDLVDSNSNPIPWAIVDANYNAWIWCDALGVVHWNDSPDFSALTQFDGTSDDPDWSVAFLASDGISVVAGLRTATTSTPGLPTPSAWYLGANLTAGLAPQSQFTDILHEVLHGQSLAEGDESYVSGTGGTTGLTASDTGWGSIRFARGYNTWSAIDNAKTPSARDAAGFSFVSGTAVSLLGESSIAGMSDHLKMRLAGSRFAAVDQSSKPPRVIGTYGARGSTRLTAINKRDNTGSVVTATSATSLSVSVSGSTSITVAASGPWAVNDNIGLFSRANYRNQIFGTVTAYSGTTLTFTVTGRNGSGTYTDWDVMRDGHSAPGGYYATALDDVTRAKAAALATGKTYSVSWVRWMQGERNSDLYLFETDASPVAMSAAISDYKTRLLLLAGDFDADIRAITGQTRRIPFLTYQTNYHPAAEAQLQAAAASRDVIMIGPHYAVPSAINAANFIAGTWNWGATIHLSPDGQRWFGEMSAKVGYRVLFEGEAWEPLRPIAAREIDSVTIDVDFNVPRGPLVLDTSWFAKITGWGFHVYNGSVDSPANIAAPTAAVVTGPQTVRFTFASAIPADAIIATGRYSTYDLGISPAVTAVGTGTTAPLGGYPRYTLTLAGDLSAKLAPLIAEGAFTIAASGGKTGVIRSVAFGANTVLTGETRELGGAAFAVSDVLTFGAAFARTNLRDSDPAASINVFGDATSGTRAGQAYPMWNWCVLFAGMPVTGA